MKFSENWLRSHVPTNATRDALSATLTAIGLEVEDVANLGDGLDNIVVARIVECAKHPEADRLQICQVEIGQGECLQIVCGAPNARAGLVAPLAMIGAKLGEISIKAAKLRGVASNGMLCSAKEIGIDADASGLLELPDDAPIGAPLADYLGLPDASIEIKLTPNRADCFSVRGIAFDVAAACGSQVVPFDAAPVTAQHERRLQVTLDAGADAPRYCGRIVEGVDVSVQTPIWMAERLRRSGVRPVSLLVDITQYVMLELGQPMHAFDRDLLKGPIGVRKARAGESLQLLDGRTAALDDGFLVITDADRPVALAGIMGGQGTKVTDTTRNVFLESAYFAPSAIIGRGRRLGLHTDASHRYERGVDPALAPQAIEVATRLIIELAGGSPGPVVHTALENHLPTPAPITLRRARVARILGLTITDTDIERILRALGMQVTASDGGWLVVAPSRRFDIAIEEDLIEELARIHGYDQIPATLPGGATRIAADTETRLDVATVRRQLVAREFLETVNFAFVDAQLLERWGLANGAVPLANPLSSELGIMRTFLLPGLVSTLQRNAARQVDRIRLFEIGNVFEESAVGEVPRETMRIAAAVCGDAKAEQWGDASCAVDFHDLKGDLESLAAASGAKLSFQPAPDSFGHPGRSAQVLRDGEVIGWIGELHPRLLKALDLDMSVIGFEIELSKLVERALPKAAALSRFPSVRRDLAFTVDADVPFAFIEQTIRSVAGPLLQEVTLFDRYVGAGVENGQKSLAMGLILQDSARTLNEHDVDSVVAETVAVLAREHNAKIRG